MSNLNVLALGNDYKINRIMACVCDEGINIITVSQIQEGFSKSQNGAIDLVLVDSTLKDAESFCRDFFEISKIPVILFIAGNEENWPDFCFYKVDGFLSEDASNIELVARLKAFARRKTKINIAN